MKPRIVILSAFLTPFRSGAEACAEEVPRHLTNRYDCVIVTARLRRNLSRRDVLRDIPVVRVGIGHSIDKWLYPFLAPFAARRLRPALVHAVLETYAGLALAICRFALRGVPRLLTLQTTNRSFLKAFIIRSADRVTAISRHLKAIAEEAGARDVALISNGIDLKSLEQAVIAHPKVPGQILFVGRLEKMKGVDVLLAAFAPTPSPSSGGGGGQPHSYLRIVGDGSQRKALEALAGSLGLQDRVTFVGRVSPDHIAAEYAQAEVFCGLSRSEGLGNVFLEAQAAGCAVVATRVGGIPDIVIDGQTGLLVPPDDPDAAAQMLQCVLNDQERRTRLATAASAHAKQYDWSAIAAQYAAAYVALLQR